MLDATWTTKTGTDKSRQSDQPHQVSLKTLERRLGARPWCACAFVG
jgi:hypothetical protein